MKNAYIYSKKEQWQTFMSAYRVLFYLLQETYMKKVQTFKKV
jgi:hypothetical protein